MSEGLLAPPGGLPGPRVLPGFALPGAAGRQRFAAAGLAAADAALAAAVWALALGLQGVWGRGGPSEVALAAIAPSVAVWVGLRALLGLYPGYGLDGVQRLRRHVWSVLFALALLAVFAVGFHVGDRLSRLMLLLAFGGLLLAAPFVQYAARRALRRAGVWGKPVVVLGYPGTGESFLGHLGREWDLGYRPAALFDYNLLPAGEGYREAPYEKTLRDAAAWARRRRVDTCIFATPHTRREQLAEMISVASESFREVIVIPNLDGVANSAVVARNLAGTFAVEVRYNLLDPWAQRAKRALDLLLAGALGLALAPLLLLLALLIRLDSPGAALFRQRRPGKDGRPFWVCKFRTMHADAEERLARLFGEEPALAEEFRRHGKLRDDPRVTRVGRFLRKTSLDELPQLWNVIKGEMSLVGPRPYLDIQRSQIDEHERFILRVPPGISGLWQVSGRSDTTLEERVRLDTYYVMNWSVWLDLIVLARTVLVVLRGSGAY
ncbi:Undecaprenyl-phosphate galactosephosphotransferase [Rubrobacter xylanophilus DSM 9941]|uniref:Undecaprenyl-phosphate galactosephosphotransferase n=1 Tax=Rubrobacter xylanophilus (strain DSM 9941 / JCM 11954 / NBRC 16129 / PRD-1) TaxID=266117 RepID=Q1AUQ0_RUBXD|nr:undecaprenyl-phosphate galactose phosphotransferase WbaP [Rubrobacter xylanophilus]ABG04878.1 Undecaprenyl-phosphate galactosephosphotransferase [Rubrobacter xylanophilus DSM 9941]